MPASEEQWAAASLLNVVSLGLFWANNLYPSLPTPNQLSTDIYIHFYSTMREIHCILRAHPEYIPPMEGILQLVPLPSSVQLQEVLPGVPAPQDLVVPAPQPNPRRPRDGPATTPEGQEVQMELAMPAPQPPPIPSRADRPKAARAKGKNRK